MMSQSTPTGFPHLPFLPPNFLQFGGMMNPFLPSPAHFAQSLMQQQQQHQENEESNRQKHGADLLASLGLPPFKMPRLDTDLNGRVEEEEKRMDEEKVESEE
jgi:acetyl esterase/lipase